MRNIRFGLALLLAAGCGPGIAPNPPAVDVSGSVTAGGKPVNGIILNLQPIGDGLPAAIPVEGGNFQSKVTPGLYTYFITKGSSAESLSSIPEKYAVGAMDRQIDVVSGSRLDLKLE